LAHKVEFSLPKRELGKADIEFLVSGDSGLIGTLKVSKGSVVWCPKDTSNRCKMSWKRFDQVVKAESIAIEKR
jgi:hypothetical protein